VDTLGGARTHRHVEPRAAGVLIARGRALASEADEVVRKGRDLGPVVVLGIEPGLIVVSEDLLAHRPSHSGRMRRPAHTTGRPSASGRRTPAPRPRLRR